MVATLVCRTVHAGDIWAALVFSFFVLAALFFFVADTTMRFVRKDDEELWTLAAMAICFLVVAQTACIYWIHIRNNIPQELSLLEKYLTRGKIVIGDVHYPVVNDASCCKNNFSTGTVIYRHPMAQYKGCFVRKQVTLVDRYERELETMLILPGEPYSAQPRSDIQGLLAIGRKRYEITSKAGTYSLVVFIFCLISAAYVVFVMYSLDTSEDEPIWIRYLGWVIYGLACVIIPAVSLLVSGIKWKHYLEWMKRGNHQFVQDDDDDYSTLARLPGGVRKTIPKQEI